VSFNLTETQLQRFRELDIGVVYLFGTYAEGKQQPLSDIDFGIVFLDGSVLLADMSRTYNELYDILTDVFPGKSIDIVFLGTASLEIRFDAITHGQVIYEHSREARLQFEEKTTLLYADFKPLLDQFNHAVLERI
jgi:predicted nucleotidyltransferase